MDLEEIENKLKKMEKDGKREKEDIEESLNVEKKKRKEVEKRLENIEKWIRRGEKERKEAEETIKDLKKKVEEIEGKIAVGENNNRKSRGEEGDDEGSESEEAECWQDVVLFCKKGENWKEGEELADWVMRETGENVKRIEKQGEEKYRIIFKSKKARDLLWRKEREYYLRKEVILDEWLTYEERREREAMVKTGKQLRAWGEELGMRIDVIVENKRMKLVGGWYEPNGKGGYRMI